MPHKFEVKDINSSLEAANAIKTMIVRGAPLIGVMGAYGLMLDYRKILNRKFRKTYDILLATRPTAVNLKWSLDRIFKK